MTHEKPKKGLILYSESRFVAEAVNQNREVSGNIQWDLRAEVSLEDKEFKNLLLEYDISLLFDQYTLMGPKAIQHRSVGSHFLQYIDLVANEAGRLWGHSVFSMAFREVLLSAIKNQDFKGPVIFLGASPIALPIIDVLAKFGFNDFVFLALPTEQRQIASLMDNLKGTFGINVSSVSSATFIQSQKEYSFCFVMDAVYPQQTLEDMSYFHFLSSKSMVFNAVGESNFLFKEIRALEVNVTDFEAILNFWLDSFKESLVKLPQK